ncbi:MAG: galactoside O-acetyltransferase [Proteobacteria bacterium]|nr:galactoside O-acetyltransferase [Pseudomonadota bacterium]
MSDNKTEFRVDTRHTTPEEFEKGKIQAQLVFELNHTMPFTERYTELVQELFKGNIGSNVMVNAPLTCVCADMVKIGNNVVIMNNCLMMARGGITIEDGAMIAANVQLISNNHDLHERAILTCKPVRIGRNAWIGAGATILPGVTVGENAVVGAGSVVTKDVVANTIVAGNPARFIKNVE